MPYGKDFLDDLGEIISDDGSIRSKIETTCTECHGKINKDWVQRGQMNQSYYESWYLPCEACKRAKLVDWDGEQYTSVPGIWD